MSLPVSLYHGVSFLLTLLVLPLHAQLRPENSDPACVNLLPNGDFESGTLRMWKTNASKGDIALDTAYTRSKASHFSVSFSTGHIAKCMDSCRDDFSGPDHVCRKTCGKRSEIAFVRKYADKKWDGTEERELFYAWSFMIPFFPSAIGCGGKDYWPVIIQQFHTRSSGNGRSPVLGFCLRRDTLDLFAKRIQIRGRPDQSRAEAFAHCWAKGSRLADSLGRCRSVRVTLASKSIEAVRWYDIVLHVKWSISDSIGFVSAAMKEDDEDTYDSFRNKDGIDVFHYANRNDTRVHLKFGLYLSCAGFPEEVAVYYDNIAVSLTRESLCLP